LGGKYTGVDCRESRQKLGMLWIIYKEKNRSDLRVVTDYATFAYLADVFILDSYRGQGLSKWLLECVMQYPELQGLRRWLLLRRHECVNMPHGRIIAPHRDQRRDAAAITKNPYDFRY